MRAARAARLYFFWFRSDSANQILNLCCLLFPSSKNAKPSFSHITLNQHICRNNVIVMLHDGKSFNLQIKEAPISSVVALLASTVWCKLVSDNHQIVAIAHMFTWKSLFFLGIVVVADKVPYSVNSSDWQFSDELLRGCNAHVPWNVHHSAYSFADTLQKLALSEQRQVSASVRRKRLQLSLWRVHGKKLWKR